MSDDHRAAENEPLSHFDALDDTNDKLAKFKEEAVDSPKVKEEEPIDDALCTIDNSIDTTEEAEKLKDENFDDFACSEQKDPPSDDCSPAGKCRPIDQTSSMVKEPEPPCAVEGPSKATTGEKKKYVRRCDACGEKTTSYSVLPADPQRAMHFCRNLTDLTSEQIEKIEIRANEEHRSGICKKHIKQFTELKRNYYCYLCGKLTNEHRELPSETSQRNAFLNSMIVGKKKDVAKIEMLMRSRTSAVFCSDHFGSSSSCNDVSNDVKGDGGTIDAQTCDLCGEKPSSFLISPKDPSLSHNFFSNLIELTSELREKAEILAKKNSQSTICKKHVEQVSAEPLKGNIPPTKRAKLMDSLVMPDLSDQKINNDRFRSEKTPIDDESLLDEELIEEPGPSR